jgi:hypothetical protein
VGNNLLTQTSELRKNDQKGRKFMSPSASMAVRMQKLNTTQRKELSDFIDFLVMRRRRTSREKSRKDRLTQISVWSSKDIKPVEEAMAEVNSWKLPNF